MRDVEVKSADASAGETARGIERAVKNFAACCLWDWGSQAVGSEGGLAQARHKDGCVL